MVVRPDVQGVEAYIKGQPREMGDILRAARAGLRAAAPDAVETVKWGAPTYVGRGNIFALVAYKDHVNIQFYRGAELADSGHLLEGTGKSLRHVKLHSVADGKGPAIKALLRAAVRLDKSP